MNNKRRKEIGLIIMSVQSASRQADASIAADYVDSAKDATIDVRDEEQDCLNNLPENLESSDMYRKMEDAVDYLDDAIDSLDDAYEELSDEYGTIEDAKPSLDNAIDSLERARE